MTGKRSLVFILLLVNIQSFAQQTLEHAWDLAAKGQRQDAIAVLNHLAKAEPKNADVRLLLGSLLMEAGERTESLEHLSEAVHLRPKSAEAENALGEAYEKFGEPVPAREAFQRAVTLDPKLGVAQLNFGRTLLSATDARSAADHLDRAIQLLGRTEDGAYAHYLRAKGYTAESNPQMAAIHLQTAVSILPQLAEAWSDLGQTRRSLLDNEGALQAFEKAVQLNSQDAVAQYRFGAELLRQGQPHVAAEHLQKANALNPTDQATLNALQMALRQDGKSEEAALVKQKLTDLLKQKDQTNNNQLRAIALNNEGAELERQKNLSLAEEKYRQAMELYPDMIGIRVNYAVLLLRSGQWTTGLEQLHQAYLKNPSDAKVKAAMEDALRQAPARFRPLWAGQIR